MAFLRSHRLWLALVALLIAVGHGHQVLEQFEMHYHAAVGPGHPQADTCGDHYERHDGSGPKDQDSNSARDHLLMEHTSVAVVSVPFSYMPPVAGALLVASAAGQTAPESQALEIEHPPQLA